MKYKCRYMTEYVSAKWASFDDLWNTHIDATRQISVFEYIYDSLSPDSSNYDKFLNELVNTLMDGMNITYYKSNYSDLLKQN